MANITLHPVTKENFKPILRLKVGEHQSEFVETNLYSIAQSKVEPENIVAGIYADDTLVGFVMYSFEENNTVLYLTRFMVDLSQQGKGYGVGTLELLKNMAIERGMKAMGLSTSPENERGIRIYEKFGFTKTGEISYGELEFICDLNKS